MREVRAANARKLFVLLLAPIMCFGMFFAAPLKADAASGFNAGNIISDAHFYDGSAMTAADVQSFLNAKMPRCTIGDPGRTAGMAWGNTFIAEKCMRDFSMTTSSRAANAYCGSYVGRVAESAAQIIAKVGAACGISQKVLLVMLEKEQSLVTDSWPTVQQFNRAMGYACPDDGPNNSANCDPSQQGFMQQVYRAAWQYKVYKAHPGSYNYKPFQFNTIQWHPNISCGTSQVYIENWATAALYIYTPYRPNQAALDAGWGTGDACSSYGNRNFFNFFTSWFGSPQAPDLSPVGSVESTTSGVRRASISGYAFDPETAAPIEIHYYIGGTYESGGRWGGAQAANRQNATVERKYPSYGGAHGFEISLTALTAPTQVCIYAINVGQGATTLLGCPTAAPISGAPVGNYEGYTLTGGKARASGWVIDPDTVGTVAIHAYRGGPFGVGKWAGSFSTGASRADVQKVYPDFGAQTGFEFEVAAPKATERLCLYAIDVQGKSNKDLGCRTLATAGSPIGNFEAATSIPGGAKISGWTLDRDTAAPIDIHVYVDGQWGGSYKADKIRPDVGNVFPEFGSAHGFDVSISGLQAGAHKICVFGFDAYGDPNTQLGCRTVQVASSNPFGSFEGFVDDGVNGNVATGWVIDPDTTASVEVHAYLDDRWYGAFQAGQPRPDVARIYPSYGEEHGFVIPVTASGRLCVYAINLGAGDRNPLLGCRTR